MSFENVSERLKRYSAAKHERELKINKFVQAYRMAYPTNNKWLIQGEGSFSEDKTNYRWDTTAVQGLKTFASNIQTLLMPPFQQWSRFIPGPEFDDAAKKQMEDALVTPSRTVFQALDSSNLMLEVDIAFQDMGIAVGLLQIHATGDPRNPIRFQSIPMHTVALGAYQGRIEDVYRTMKIPARDIPSVWPDAKLTDSIAQMIKTSPGKEIELLEGTIYYPMNPPSHRYLYFVLDMSTKEDIVQRPQSMSRWIPFRFSVSPGEVWGEGPVLQILDTIRITNKIVEMDVLNAGYKISRPLFVNGSKVLNPNNIKMEPGAIIHVNDTQAGQLPIVPLDIAGDFNFDQITLEGYQSQIRDALFADPLGPSQTPNQSATETSIRQQNWIKKSASSMGRLANELLRPIVLKTAVLLQEQGLMPSSFHINPDNMEMSVDGQAVDVDFLSPLATLDDMKEAEKFGQFNAELQQIMGPQLSMGVLNIPDIPQYLASKMSIDTKLVKDSDEIAQMQQQMQQAAQQQQQQEQQQAQQAAQPAPQPGQPPQLPQLNIAQG